MCTYEWKSDTFCWQFPRDGEHLCRIDYDHGNEDHVCWCDEVKAQKPVATEASLDELRKIYGYEIDSRLLVFNDAYQNGGYIPISGQMLSDNLVSASAPIFMEHKQYVPPKLTLRQRIARSKLNILWNLRVVDIRDYHREDECDGF